jgi:hypothetical protein
MKLRRKTPNDSLYLLLDTLCNAFGGIILLAVLVVLLTSQEKMQSETASDSRELLQRRLALAQANLQESHKLEASLQARANDERWKQQVDLLSNRTELQNEIQLSQETSAQDSKELDAAEAANPAERLKFLNEQLAKAQLQRLQETNRLAAMNEDIKHQQQRLADLGLQVTNRQQDLQRPLRLPREHGTDKEPVYIIVRYGHMYPCKKADLSRNEIDIHWTIKGDEIADPIPGKGVDPLKNAAAVNAYFQGLAANSRYVFYCVFPDSFPAFVRAKDAAIENGFAYGWQPFLEADAPVVFSTFGQAPTAQ